MTPVVRFLKKNVLPFKSVQSVSLLGRSNGQPLLLPKSWADEERDEVRYMEAT
jgi:hypothetical protein